jgi:hypothetical protein
MLEFPLTPLIQTWESLDFIDQWLAGQLEVQRRLRFHDIKFQPDTWDRLSNILTALDLHCSTLGCSAAVAKIRWMRHRLGNGGWSTWQELKNDIVEMKTAIYSHLQTLLVMVMPHDKVAYYQNAALFDASIVAVCSECALDIAEAGKCFAFGRWTATVFHLMRVMEHGVHRFADKLGVTINPRDPWGAVLNAIDPAVNRMPAGTPAEREKQTAYQGLRASLHAVKEAWRNPTMHPRANYNEQEAREIFELVKTFMRRLVSVLSDGASPPAQVTIPLASGVLHI